jgi:hypothetical protein
MKKYTIAQLFKTSWNELSQKQFLHMIELGEMHMRVACGSKEFGVIIIDVLSTLRKNVAAVSKLNIEQVVDCFNAITFFQRTKKGGFRMPWYFFPVGTFTMSRVNFAPPKLSDGLPMYNLIFDQLVYADSIFSRFCVLSHQYTQLQSKELESQIEDALNALVAVLYTDPDYFSPEHIERNASLIPHKLSAQQRALILHTYANIRDFLMSRCPTLFPRPEDDEQETEEPVPPVPTGTLWMNLRYHLAETDVFKGLETARNAKIYDALDYLEQKAIEAKERNKQHE